MLANQSPTIISREPHGHDNHAFVNEHNEIESGLGSSDLTPNGTMARCRETAVDPGNYSMHDFRKSKMSNMNMTSMSNVNMTNMSNMNNIMQIPYRNAVSVESGRLNFGSFKALQNISMNVQEGTIYGLLGSSGCGKTTLLSCLVGLRSLDGGQILICGKTPGSRDSGVPGRLVGYMPQEIALNGEFTVREVCHFFGRLYGMRNEQIDERVDYLINLLDLKRCKALLKDLSGGQKRRASFLVALLHEPEILILDEPTVGVDPVLRASIWNHLRELVDKLGTTVIITTHYIEEMRQADTVGIMRDGHLMVEASPQELLESHNATMLEEVVLHYCLRNEEVFGRDNVNIRDNCTRPRGNHGIPMAEVNTGVRSKRLNGNRMDSVTALSYTTTNQNMSYGHDGRMPSRRAPYTNHLIPGSDGKGTLILNRLQALTTKNLMVLFRNLEFLIFILLMPAGIVAVYCYAIDSNPKHLHLGIVNEDGGDCKVGQAQLLKPCSPNNLSCVFLDEIRNSGYFDLYYYPSKDAALKGMEEKETWGFVHFGPNFSQHIYDRTLGVKNTNETIYGSRISTYLDMTSVTTGQLIKTVVFANYRSFSQNLLLGCNIDITGRDLPVTIGNPIYGQEEHGFRGYLAPGVTIAIVSFMSSLTCGLAFIVEKKDGMIHRTKVAGVNTIDIMLSHVFPQVGIIIIQTIITFLLMFLVFDIPKVGSIYLAFLSIVCYSISGLALGFLAATVFDEEKNAMLFAIGVLFPSFILAGIIWPLETLPSFCRQMGLFIPGGMASETLRSILLRGWGISNFYVYMGFISSFISIIIYVILCFLILKIRK